MPMSVDSAADGHGVTFTPAFAPKLEPELGWRRVQIAARAARDISDGAYVNLGIGVPQLIADNVPPGTELFLHSENGVLGIGGEPPEGEHDPDLADAGKRWATVKPGAAIFDSSDSFGIIRGGHLDLAVLGALEVSPAGDLANWTAPGRPAGVGGAMDLVQGAKQVWVLALHNDRRGRSKLVRGCTLPLTGSRVVSRIYTNLGVFEPGGDAFVCRELAPGITEECVLDRSEASVRFELATERAAAFLPEPSEEP